MGLFDFIGDLFGGGGGGTVVHTTTVQEAAQAANITVNPQTTVSLSIDTTDIATALENYGAFQNAIASKDFELAEKMYQSNLTIGLTGLKLMAEELSQGKTALLQAQTGLSLESQGIIESQKWLNLGENALILLKRLMIAGGLIYLVTRR